jgi:hypothetical protein
MAQSLRLLWNMGRNTAPEHGFYEEGRNMTKHLIALTLTLAFTTIACGDDTDTKNTGPGGQTAAGGQGAGGGAPVCTESMSTAECTTYCEGAIAAGCPDSPTQTECEDQCGQLNDFVSMCPAWGGLVDCAGDSPTFTCMFGERVPEGCEEQFYCLSLCFD